APAIGAEKAAEAHDCPQLEGLFLACPCKLDRPAKAGFGRTSVWRTGAQQLAVETTKFWFVEALDVSGGQRADDAQPLVGLSCLGVCPREKSGADDCCPGPAGRRAATERLLGLCDAVFDQALVDLQTCQQNLCVFGPHREPSRTPERDRSLGPLGRRLRVAP